MDDAVIFATFVIGPLGVNVPRAQQELISYIPTFRQLMEISEDEIDEFVNDKNVLLYTLIKDGWPVGFYMLDYRKEDICDLSFFGLVDEVIGVGLGKYLLQTAILTAWDSKKIKKLTVNTCSLDHKSAIYLYQKYGFTPVKYKDLEKTV